MMTLTTSLLPWEDTPNDALRRRSTTTAFLVLAALVIGWTATHPVVEQPLSQAEVTERIAHLVAAQPKPEKPVVKPVAALPTPHVAEKPSPAAERSMTDQVAPPSRHAMTASDLTHSKAYQQATDSERQAAHEKAAQAASAFDDAFAGLPSTGDNGAGLPTGTGAMAGSGHDLQQGGDKAVGSAPGRDLIATAAGSGAAGGAGVAVGRLSGHGSRGGHGNGALHGTGGGLGGAVHSSVADDAAAQRQAHADDGGGRDSSSIREGFDRYAGRMNLQYQLALRQNPALQGDVVLHLTITAGGQVTAVSVVSSGLQDDDLMQKLLTIVRTMQFPSAGTKDWSGDYTLHFFPH